MKRTVRQLAIALAVAAMVACNQSGNDVEQYMNFLYTYMPLPDRADYPREFYQWNVEKALQARREMAWGQQVPEREFRHFVLPVRVNNENLDSCRGVFFDQLKPRLQGLTMQEAILEVNHWCHEYVTYRPSDARTSSPLATIRTAYGRCGEESTLLVAALRSVCIPARQVYTPRWAHTDDNHAWVEAWADGQWFFLGACEPEPVLNLGWFNESASRGMLMHTKVFGDYDGPEEVMSRTPCYTEINVIDHYAPTQKVTVRVTDSLQQPVADALVEFKLYNYAEFYTVASKTTDASGRVSLTAGRGDMLVWASKQGRAGIQKVSFDSDKEVTLSLDSRFPIHHLENLDLVPPVANATLPEVTDEQRAENNRRLAIEDSIRRAYEQTMPNEEWRGNHRVIQAFLDEAADKQLARRLLDVISEKDLRDITLEVLRDSYEGAVGFPLDPSASSNEDGLIPHSQFYDRYVLSPRVENEMLTPYKAFFREKFAGMDSVEALVAWCSDSVQTDSCHNPQRLRMRPMSVYRERLADELGRDIFFVSVARSLGFAARINEVNGKPQYFKQGKWVDVVYGSCDAQSPLTSHLPVLSPVGESEGASSHLSPLTLVYRPVEHYDDPKYYIHFTLSRLENGRAQLMTFPEEATWQKNFAKGVELEDGDYLLTTGTRLASGKVLAHVELFTLNGPTTITFTMREDPEEPQVIGSLNAEGLFASFSPASGKTGGLSSILSTTGRGFYVLGIVASGQEPTNHALRDIGAYSKELEQWGRKMVLLFESDADARRFNYAEFASLPSTVEWGVDADGKILEEVCTEMKLRGTSLPVFLVCDTFNRVVFVSQGYTINLGEQLMKVIRQL